MSLLLNEKEVLDAIKDSAGIISTIAKRLQCSWNSAKTYTSKWESTSQAYSDENERVLDMAESALLENIKKKEMDAIKFYLTKKGRVRGYGDQLSITGNVSITGGLKKLLESIPEEDISRIFPQQINEKNRLPGGTVILDAGTRKIKTKKQN